MVNRLAVAKEAGVSPYTVSVVLNDSEYGRVSTEVRERVKDVAGRLGYRPHAAGRALRLGRTELIAYLTTPQLLHEVSAYHTALLPALLSTANETGYDLAILGDDSADHLLDRLRRALQAGRYDGIVLGRPRLDDPVIDLLRESAGRVPFVLAGAHPDKTLHQVRRDDVGISQNVAERLVALGHRRVGLLFSAGNAAHHEYARLRRETLLECFAFPGGEVVELQEDLTEAVDVAWERGLTAIVSENDSLAVGVIDAAEAAGLIVPDDLAVVSLYGVRRPAASRPSLASVCVDPSDASSEAVRLLAAIVEGRTPETGDIILPSWFIEGESLGSPGRRARTAFHRDS